MNYLELRRKHQELVMEMELVMDSLWFHLNPPLPPSSGQEAFSYYPPFATAVMTNKKRDVDPTPAPPPSRSRAAARKDRHRKICTAGGMRGPRIRLSQDVARRFFALQDKLGFDKASKTVQWLLDMSTTGINHLSASMSWSEEGQQRPHDGGFCSKEEQQAAAAAAAADAQGKKKSSCSKEEEQRNGAPVLVPDKALRVKARQRARERTKDRNRLQSEAPALARQLVVPVLPAASCNSYYDEQELWELGEVVFAKPRFH